MDQLMQSLPMFLMMIGVVYFLIIRPQNKKMKDHRELIESLKRGDEVVTQGGLIGKITKVSDEEVTVELGDGVKVRVVKVTIGEVRNRPEPKPANDSST